MKISCPKCHKPGISALRACWLGPALPTRCKECGTKIAPPYWSILFVLPFIAAYLLVSFFIEGQIQAFFIGLFAGMAMQSLFAIAPLQSRE